MSTPFSWKWVWLTGLIAAAIASYGILLRSPENNVVSNERPVQPGYYLKDAVLTITQPDGRQRLKLVAERIDERILDKSFAVQGVSMDYSANPGRPWTLRADSAAVPADLQSAELSGHVEVRGGQAEREGVIRTEFLMLDMQTNVASTSAPVEIEFAGQRLNATGLKADLNSETLQLESGVNGRFQ
jgi:LPS export ABC transporter protein LptC